MSDPIRKANAAWAQARGRVKPPTGLNVTVDQASATVAPEQAQEIVLSGRGTLHGDTQLVVRGADILEIPTQNLAKAIARGWALTDEAGAHSVRIRREEDTAGGIALGIGEAALSGLTMDTSPLLEQALGVDPERMAARHEAAGAAAPIAEFAGIAAPAAFSGGRSLVARGLGLTPTGLLMRGATRAGGLAGSAMARPLARKLVSAGVQGGIEGFGFGAGSQVSEDVLGNRELALDRTLAAGGMGALLGGGLGPLMAGGAHLAVAGAKGSVRGAKAILRRATGITDDGAATVAEQLFAEGNVPKLAQTFNLVPEDIAPIAANLAKGAAGRNRLRMIKDQPEKMFEEIASTMRAPTEAVRDTALDMWTTIGRANKMRTAGGQIPQHLRDAALMKSTKAVADLQGRVRTAFSANEAAGGELMDRGVLHQLNAMANRTAAILEVAGRKAGPLRAAGSGAELAVPRAIDDDTIGMVYDALDSLKRDGQALYQDVRRAAGGLGPPTSAQNTARFFDGSLHDGSGLGLNEVRDLLMDDVLWGARGVAQREVNEAVTYSRRLEEGLMDTASKRILNTRKHDRVYDGDLISLVEKGARTKGAQAFEQFREVLDARMHAAKVIGKHYEMSAEAVANREAAERALAQWDEAHTAAQKIHREKEAMDLLRANDQMPGDPIGPFVAAGVGSALGGPIGGVVGGLGSMLLRARNRPYALLQRYLGMTRAADRGTGMQRGALAEFLKKMGPKATRAAEAAGSVFENTGRVGRIAAVKMSASERRERDKRVDVQARGFADNPAAIEAAVYRATAHLDDLAPGYVDGAFSRLTTASAFLASKAPKEYKDPWAKGDGLVDPVAQARYSRYIEAVDTPFASIARLADGSFTLEHAEALQAVYPALYADIRSGVLEAMTSAESVPYSVRLMIGHLFGASLDPTSAPGFVSRIQATFAVQPPQGKPHAGGRVSSTTTTSAATRIEKGLNAQS